MHCWCFCGCFCCCPTKNIICLTGCCIWLCASVCGCGDLFNIQGRCTDLTSWASWAWCHVQHPRGVCWQADFSTLGVVMTVLGIQGGCVNLQHTGCGDDLSIEGGCVEMTPSAQWVRWSWMWWPATLEVWARAWHCRHGNAQHTFVKLTRVSPRSGAARLHNLPPYSWTRDFEKHHRFAVIGR